MVKQKHEVGQIEHNVPMPKARGRVSSIAAQMKLGDSVVIHWHDVPALRMAMSRMGFRLMMQPISNEEQLARCWMIARK